MLGDGGVYSAAGAATAVMSFVAAVAAAAGSSSGVGNGAAIAPVVLFSGTTGLIVDTIAANACASAYKKDAALYVGDMLVMVLRVVERLEIIVMGLGGGRAIAWKATDASMDDTVIGLGLGLGDTLAGLIGRVLRHREGRQC